MNLKYVRLLYILAQMDLYNQGKLYGVHEGVQYGQNERTEELNRRMEMRNYSDSPLAPNFDPRSVSTRYTKFGVVDKYPESNTTRLNYPVYNQNANFNPGNTRSPVSGYFANVETENSLRNQYFALQHGASQGQYIPNSQSDLYKTTVVSRPSIQPYPMLFKENNFSQAPHPNVMDSTIGNDKFFNHTRTQLRNSA
jgi:hypothetical protein